MASLPPAEATKYVVAAVIMKTITNLTASSELPHGITRLELDTRSIYSETKLLFQ